MSREILLAFSLICSVAGAAEPAWQFLRVSEALTGEANWTTSQGTAAVHVENGHIRIEAFDVEGMKEPSLVIEGAIDPSGNITATGTRTHTDEKPFRLVGKFTTWQRDEDWGGQKKRIIFRDIIFPLHPHYEFYGFLSRTVADE